MGCDNTTEEHSPDLRDESVVVRSVGAERG